MVDFGANKPERPIDVLLTQKLRPGDIYTHCYSGLRGELDPQGKVNRGMIEGRKRGVIFDVGHGGGSFAWRIAVPFIEQGFLPDSISTDLHIGSMNAGMKDMLNLMSKFLSVGFKRGRCDCQVDVESGERDSSRRTGAAFGGGHCRRCGAAGRDG